MNLSTLNEKLGLPPGTSPKDALATVGELTRKAEASKVAAAAEPDDAWPKEWAQPHERGVVSS